MGQYYFPVILDEKGTVTMAMLSHEYGNGLKLMEHSYQGNAFVESFETLLALDGARRVVWAGDYADAEESGTTLFEQAQPYDEDTDREDDSKLVRLDHPHYLEAERWGVGEVYPPNLSVPFVVTSQSHPFLVNHDRKEFVDKSRVPSSTGWADEECLIHPLPLLTCEGNGRGGGDYREEDRQGLIGLWSRDRISSSPTPPPLHYTQIDFDLKED